MIHFGGIIWQQQLFTALLFWSHMNVVLPRDSKIRFWPITRCICAVFTQKPGPHITVMSFCIFYLLVLVVKPFICKNIIANHWSEVSWLHCIHESYPKLHQTFRFFIIQHTASCNEGEACSAQVRWLMTEVGLYFSNHSQSGHFHALFLMVNKSCSRGRAGTVQGASSVPK